MGNRATNFSGAGCSSLALARGKILEKFYKYSDLQHNDLNSSN